MTQALRPSGRRWHLLCRLANEPGGVTTRELAGLYGYPGPMPGRGEARNAGEWQRALTFAGNDLRYLEKCGYATRAGVAAGEWGGGSPHIWTITQMGSDWLAEAQRNREPDAALATVRAVYPEPPTNEMRKFVALWLRDRGCTYAQIGPALNMSADTARKNVLRARKELSEAREKERTGHGDAETGTTAALAAHPHPGDAGHGDDAGGGARQPEIRA